MNFKQSIIVAAAAIALAGCAQSYSASVGAIDAAEFGEANRQTYAAMVIDPNPTYTEPLTTSGEHAAQAVDRYRNDQVKQPVMQSTSETVSGGGAGPGGT